MRALVCAGGGAKGSFTAGVIAQLDGKYDFAVGTSVGSLCATGYSHEGADGLRKLWFSIKDRGDVLDFSFARKGLFTLDPLAEIVGRVVTHPAAFPVHCCAVRLEDGAVTYSQSGDSDFKTMIIASCSIPGAVEPVEHQGSTYVDGGTLNNTPIQHAIDMGADDLDVILCNPIDWIHEWAPPEDDIFPVTHYVARAWELMTNDKLLADLAPRPGVKMRIWAPSVEVCGVFDFTEEAIRNGYQMGIAAHPVSV